MPAKRTLFPDPCPNCDKEVPRKNKYCNNQCQKDYEQKEVIRKWLLGELDVSTVLGCSSSVKRYLLDQCNHKCPKCGWSGHFWVGDAIILEIFKCPRCTSGLPNPRLDGKVTTLWQLGWRLFKSKIGRGPD
jgi:predicted RNA-binding Zn-ribbon protein involved in translation (DUF1610 family)